MTFISLRAYFHKFYDGGTGLGYLSCRFSQAGIVTRTVTCQRV
uniref:Uncharacterized protein n=1 Tax=Anguilla anguilla TaxID=7936 RepID=A0A0E9UE91_ANGAN